MPELPEVETVRKQLEKEILNSITAYGAGTGRTYNNIGALKYPLYVDAESGSVCEFWRFGGRELIPRVITGS